jgi:transposase
MQLDLNNLPKDPALLHRLVCDIAATIEHRDSEIERLKSTIKQLQRAQFGRRSVSIPTNSPSGLMTSTAISPAPMRAVRGSRTNNSNGPPIASRCPTICHATMCGSISTT